LIVIADHIPEELLASFQKLSERSGRPIILGDNCKIKFSTLFNNSARISVDQGERLVQLNPDGARQNLGTMFDIPTARHMNDKNDLLNIDLDETQRTEHRKKIEMYSGPCEIIQGNVREKVIKKHMNYLVEQKGGNYVATKKSSGEMTTVLIQHGRYKGIEPASVRELKIQNIIKKVTPKNGKPTHKPAIIIICFLTKTEAKRIAIEAKRPIIASGHNALTYKINSDKDFILTSPRGFYKYSPKQEPSGEYSCDKGEFIGKQLVLPRTEETSRELAREKEKKIERVKEPITPADDVTLDSLATTNTALRRRRPQNNTAAQTPQQNLARRERGRRLPV